MDYIIEEIRRDLLSLADENARISGQRFFREEIKLYGVRAADIKKLSRQKYREIRNLDTNAIYRLCDLLWQSGYTEEAFVACNWSYYISKRYQPGDFEIFEGWVSRYVTNWATCDTLCNHTIGSFIEMFPEYLSGLKNMSRSDNRWMRRAAAVSLIVPARKGKFIDDIFEITDSLLTDKDDMVRKGYGWLLKASSQAYPDRVFNYVMMNKNIMPRTSLRYAIEKLPPDMRSEAMAKS